jgi:hypothetical protein
MAAIKREGQVYRYNCTSLIEAETWVKAKREELHGEFANHG